MLSINNFIFMGTEINFSTDSILTYKQSSTSSAPLPVLNFVVDESSNKIVDNDGNYWVT